MQTLCSPVRVPMLSERMPSGLPGRAELRAGCAGVTFYIQSNPPTHLRLCSPSSASCRGRPGILATIGSKFQATNQMSRRRPFRPLVGRLEGVLQGPCPSG